MIDSRLSKRDVIRMAEALDQRRQAQIDRQIDTINRLMEAQDLEPGLRYEHEMVVLNNHLAAMDQKLEWREDQIRRMLQSIQDRRESDVLSPDYHSMLRKLEFILTEKNPNVINESNAEPTEGQHRAEEDSSQVAESS